MKLMASGVTFSAATMRSPSFSRSSSSTTITSRPAWISSRASSIVANAVIRLQQTLDILGDHVVFQVHPISRFYALQVCIVERVRNNRDGKRIRASLRHSQADAVYGDGSLFNNVTRC